MGRFAAGRRLPRWPWSDRRSVAERPCDHREITDVLVSESEAFLLGRYAEYVDARAEPVPVWAWTNLLAHGTLEDLSRAAAGVHGGWSSQRRWRVARALAASEVVDAVRQGASLADVQRDVLVPAELAIADDRGAWVWTQQRWLASVRAALRHSPYSRMA